MQRSRNVDGLAVNVILSMKMNKVMNSTSIGKDTSSFGDR